MLHDGKRIVEVAQQPLPFLILGGLTKSAGMILDGRQSELPTGMLDVGHSSNSDMRVHFGLDQITKMDWVQVRWPSELVERFEEISVDAIHVLKKGSGTPEAPATKRH